MNFKKFNIFIFLSFILVFCSKIESKQIRRSQSSIDILRKVEFEIPIRVLIDKKNITSKEKWNFKSDKGFYIISQSSFKKEIIKDTNLNIQIKSKKLFINGIKSFSNKIFIVPIKNYIEFNNSYYEGIFEISCIGNYTYLVNKLDLEDYVSTVLPSESWPGWPDEVNKALSICIRSYGLAKILEQREILKKSNSNVPYDIKNTTIHQVYKGSKDLSKFKNVVKKTKDIVLTFQNKPILAMFDISCGGVIPSKIKSEVNFKKAPYLNRSYSCTYCKQYKCYSWQLEFDLNELENHILKILPKIGKIKEIKVDTVDNAGIVQAIKVRGNSSWHSISTQKLKKFIKLKSLFFTIKQKGEKVIFEGKGFGHLVGLCQFGLRQMIEQGWDFKKALYFYYPHTILKKINRKNFKILV